MVKRTPRYEAYCLRCLGGGKSLGRYTAKRDAEREATGHMNAFRCNVTIIDHAKRVANSGS